MARIFSSLASHNYRLFFFGQMVSVSGTWAQTVAQAFLVLELTHSGTALGLVIGAQFLPLLLFTPLGGLLADRLPKRRVLYATQATSALLAAAFAVVVGTHVVAMWMVYLLAFGLGMVNVFDNPVRQSFISEMVGPGDLRNAVALNSVTVNFARIIGPAIGGALIALVGLVACFAFNSLSFAAVLFSLVRMRAAELHPAAPLPRRPGQLRSGWLYVRTTPELAVPLIMIAVIGTLAWEFQVSLPLVARVAFHGGAGTYATMMSFMAAGAIGGGMVSASRSRTSARGLSVAAIGWGLAILAAALAPALWMELIALVFVGIGGISFNTLAKTSLQLAAVPAMRGRVMALWAVAWMGSTPIGGPIVGWVGQNLGARWSLILGGVPTVLIGLAAWRSLCRMDARVRPEKTSTGRTPSESRHRSMSPRRRRGVDHEAGTVEPQGGGDALGHVGGQIGRGRFARREPPAVRGLEGRDGAP
jgi:MFS family permease